MSKKKRQRAQSHEIHGKQVFKEARFLRALVIRGKKGGKGRKGREKGEGEGGREGKEEEHIFIA